jgi:hypothetical protein
MKVGTLLLAVLLLNMTGCAMKEVRSIETAKVVAIPAEETVPFEFSKLVFSLPEGKRVGNIHNGWACIPGGWSTARGGNATLTEGALFSKVTTTLKALNLKVVSSNDELFSTGGATTNIVLAGRVVDLEWTVCNAPPLGIKGKAVVTVEWQIFSRSENRIIQTTKTEGGFAVDAFSVSTSSDSIVSLALESSVKNLVATDSFRNAIKRVSRGEASKV